MRSFAPDELRALLVLSSIALFWERVDRADERAALLGLDEPLAMLRRRGIAAIAGALLTVLSR